MKLRNCTRERSIVERERERERQRNFRRLRASLLPTLFLGRVSTELTIRTYVRTYARKLRCILQHRPMFHGDKSAAASKCFVPSGALFSPLGASRFPSEDIGSGCRCITNRAPDIRIVLYIYLRMRNNRASPLLHSLANLPPDVITRAITGR